MDTEEKIPQSETPEPEPSKEESAQSVDDIRNQLSETSRLYEQTKSELAKAIEEAKSHQRNVSKIDRLEKQLGNLSTNFEVTNAMLADLVDRNPDDIEETPKRRRSEEYLSRIKQREDLSIQERRRQEQEALMQRATEADKLAKDAGLEVDKSPELRNAYILFRVGDADAGLEEVKRVVGKQTEADKSQEAIEAEIEKRAEEKARKILEGRGLLKSDTGTPSGGGILTRQQIAQMPQDERIERQAEIMKAISEGRVK